MAESKFDTFSEHERAIISLGLTLLVMEELLGVIVGPMPPETQARDFPVIAGLIDDLGASWDMPGIDPELVARMTEHLDEAASKSKAEQ